MSIWASAGRYNEAFLDGTTSQLLASTLFNVYIPGGTTEADIFTNVGRSDTIPQPLSTDSSGNAEFYTEPGKYVLHIASQDFEIEVFPSTDDLIGIITAAKLDQDNYFGDHIIADYRENPIILTDTTYAPSAGENNGATIALENASAIAATLSETANEGDNWAWIQEGLGQLTFSVGGTGTLKNAHSHTKSNGQYSRGHLLCVRNPDGVSAEWNLTGDTTS